jgi:predicted Zn finger-like uncharacterized protein
MSFRTTCPHCASIFRLGQDQLDAAQGWAQCGVCGAAFDARTSLCMEDGSPLPQAAEPVATPLPQENAPAEADMAPAIAADDESATPADAEDITPSVMPVGITQREEPLDLPSIIIIDPYMEVPDDPGPLPVIRSTAPVLPPRTAAPAPTPATRIEYATATPGPARISRAAKRQRKPWVWLLFSLVLLVALLAQAAWFLRDTLVSRFPAVRPGFEQACAVLGCSLSLPHDASLMRILGSDLQAEPGNARQLRLNLTLGNRAPHPQAWPMLVLTLTDSRDRPQSRRSFAPSEYLADPARVAAGIAAGSEIPLTLSLTTRDLKLAGYHLELSY